MFEQEAVRLREILLSHDGVTPLLNLGSSDARFREMAKPHIERELFAPLRAAGLEIFHADLRDAPGVDIVGDILDPQIQQRLREGRFGTILIANMLEHIRDPAAVAAACEDIVGAGGLILATVPCSYPYHADPLDTGYRPTPERLATLFTRSDPLLTEQIAGQTYRERLAERGESRGMAMLRTVLWALIFPLRPKSARARLSRWHWYNRPYRVSIALVRVRAS